MTEPQESTPAPIHDAQASRRIGVLLIVDQPDDAQLFVRELRRGGLEPRWRRVMDPTEMASALKEDAWDLVLSDHSLRHFSAAAALELLKKSGLDIPFIVVSATIEEEMVVQILKAGAHDFVTKDRFHRLLPSINRELAEARLRREHRQAEEALRQSEERFRAAAEVSTDGIALLDADHQIVYVSPTTERITGYASQELLGKDLYRSYSPVYRYHLQEILTEAKKDPDRAVPFEVRLQRPDGSWRDLEGVMEDRLADPVVRAIVVNFRDVTSRKSAEEERRLLIHNLAERIKELTALQKTSRLLQREDVTRDDILRELASFLPPAMQYPELAVSRVMLNEMEVQTGELDECPWRLGVPFHTRDGRVGRIEVGYRSGGGTMPREPFLPEEQSLLQTLAEMIQNHLDHRNAVEALRASEERLRNITDNMTDMIGQSNMEGALVYISPSNQIVLGYQPEEMLGKSPFEFVHPDDLPRVHQQYRDGMQTLQPQRAELRYRRSNGQYIWIETVGKFLTDDQGNLTGAIYTSRDITDRKRLEEQLRQSQKMEAVGTLAGGVAHDFNNLLTVINGYSDLLLGGDELNPGARDLLREIRKSGERAAALTRHLLAFSRKQMLAPVTLDLNAAIIEMGKMLRRLIGEDIHLVMDLDPLLQKINADPAQIEQVIMNLVVNSRDAMPQGGSLTIQTRNVNLDEDFVRGHLAFQPETCVRLSITDTGCGIDPSLLSHIFEPFFTTKEVGKGTGLGLSTVYGIIKQSGGEIEVDSEKGRGTTFHVYLPPIPTSNDVGLITGPNPPPSGTETVLLVEDSDQLRQLGRRILEGKGYQVLDAADGVEALDRAQEFHGPIHLLITDVVMPRMGGRQLADLLKSSRPDLKVLYMSGYTEDMILRHGLSDGNLPFLVKPFTPTTLVSKAREMLDQSSGRDGRSPTELHGVS